MAEHRTSRPRAFAVALIVTFCAIAFAAPAQGQTIAKPFSKDDVVQLLKGSVPSKRVEELARKQGIDFQITPDVETQLRQAGATNELLATLRALAFKESSHQPASVANPLLQTTPAAQEAPRAVVDRDASADISKPAALQISEVVKNRLAVSADTGRFHYWLVSLPPGRYKVIIDVQRADDKWGPTGTDLAWFSLDGQKLGDLGHVGRPDDERVRNQFKFEVKKQVRMILRVDNGWTMVDYWLGLFKGSDPVAGLFFAKSPEVNSLSVPGSATATLDGTVAYHRDAYYAVTLAAGDYKLKLVASPADGTRGATGIVVRAMTPDGVVVNDRVVDAGAPSEFSVVSVAKLSLAEKQTMILQVRARWETRQNATISIEPWSSSSP